MPFTARFLLGATIGAAGAYILQQDASPSQPEIPQMAAAGAGSQDLDATLERSPTPGPVDGAATPAQRLDAVTTLASIRPEEAFAEALALRPTRLREIALPLVSRRWALSDPESAFSALRRFPDRGARAVLARELLPILARSDPDAVRQYVLEVPLEDVAFVRNGVTALAQDDPAALIDFIGEVGNSATADTLQRYLINTVAADDPLAAAALVPSLPFQGRTSTLYRDIGQSFATADSAGALAWAASLEANARQDAVAGIMRGIANVDLARAVELALTDPQVAGELGLLFSTTTVSYSFDQVPQIADRLLTVESLESESAIANLLTSWSSIDPDSASVWLLAQRPTVIAANIALLEPTAATDWALGLPTGAGRRSALQSVLKLQMRAGTIDARVLSGLGDGSEAALLEVLPELRTLARRDQAQARAIASMYYTTPRLRDGVQEAIAGL